MAVKKTSNELITLEQLPIITQHLKAKSAEIKVKTAEYLSMVCTDETVKIVKAARAELNNEKKAFEAQRMELKSKYMAAYEEFQIHRDLPKCIDRCVSQPPERQRPTAECDPGQ